MKAPGSRGAVHVYRDAEEAAAQAAELFAAEAAGAISSRGRFRVALSGGATPRRTYQLLASPPWNSRIAWDRSDFFWSDERYVPADDPASNYRMAGELLLRRAPVPPENVHRVPVEIRPPEAAARAYEETIRGCFENPAGIPQFDFILLGVGINGHTASLFPESSLLSETRRLVAADEVAAAPNWRITMTAPLLNRGRLVVFLTEGGEKAEILRRILRGPYDPQHLPAQLIQPESGRLIWIADEAAAVLL